MILPPSRPSATTPTITVKLSTSHATTAPGRRPLARIPDESSPLYRIVYPTLKAHGHFAGAGQSNGTDNEKVRRPLIAHSHANRVRHIVLAGGERSHILAGTVP